MNLETWNSLPFETKLLYWDQLYRESYLQANQFGWDRTWQMFIGLDLLWP